VSEHFKRIYIEMHGAIKFIVEFH